MSKVTMPDPVASITINPIGKTAFIGSTRASEKLGRGDFWLISTDQAEAYANAKVKQALEEAAEVVDDYAATEVVSIIRALIPKEQT